MKTKRFAPLAAIAAALALTVVGSSCSAVDPSALTVGSWSMSDSTLQSQMNAFAKVYSASGGTATLRSQDGNSWSTSFTAAFLNDQLSLQLAKVGLERRGLSVTDQDLAAAKTTLEQNFTTGGRSVFGDLPVDYQQTLIEGVAAQSVLADAVIADATSDEALQKLYESNKDQYAGDLVCASHILITAGSGSSTSTPTDAQYATALATINGIKAQATPANFASLAAARSQDTGSASAGGDLGCSPKGTFVTAFDDAAWSLPLSTVSDPVKTQFGYHLILVSARGKLGFQQLKSTLADAVVQNAQQLLAAELARIAQGVEVSVNGRYGSYDATTARISAPSGASTPGTVVDGSSITGG